MSENILKKIIDIKKVKINKLKKDISISNLSEKISENKYYQFKDKILKNYNNDKISIIAEIKKASPSAGIIIENVEIIDFLIRLDFSFLIITLSYSLTVLGGVT